MVNLEVQEGGLLDHPDIEPFTSKDSTMIYLYGCPNRPIGYASVPEGFVAVHGPDARMHAATRHGVVEYPAPLTSEQVTSYQLLPILTPEDAASMVADSLRKYAPNYLRQPAPQFAQAIGQRIERLGVAVPASREELAVLIRVILAKVE